LSADGRDVIAARPIASERQTRGRPVMRYTGEPLIEVRHVGGSVEDRDFLFTRRQLLLENLDARLIAVLHEQSVDRPAEADISAGNFELVGHHPLELPPATALGHGCRPLSWRSF